MRILIIKLGAIGDVLRTTSILLGLKEKYNPQTIDWITSASSKEVLLNNSLIDQIFTWPEKGSLGSYDRVISLEDDFGACKLASEVDSKKIIGAYVNKGQIVYTPSAWFDMSAISRYGLEAANQLKKKNRKTFQQHMADLLGIRVGPYVFNLTLDEIDYGREFVRGLGIGSQEKVVGINTGAGKRWQLKGLGIEKTIEIVKKITNELGVVSLILGGEEEKERNEIISKETGMPNGGMHSLRNFAAVVNQCQLVLSSDSLAMHFGIALGKKLAVFFGPTSPTEIELYGLGTKVYPKIDCLVCYKKICDKKPNCMDILTTEDIFEAVKHACLSARGQIF
jgi:heptosyltransferase-2